MFRKALLQNKANWIYWLPLGVGISIIVFSPFIASILLIGDKIKNIIPHGDYGFYTILILVLLYPIINVIQKPHIDIQTLLDDKKQVKEKFLLKIANNLTKTLYLPPEELKAIKLKIRSCIDCQCSVRKLLIELYEKQLLNCNTLINNSAKLILVSTALSRNGKLDAIMVFIISLKLIKDITSILCIRPSIWQLIQIYSQVITIVFFASELQNISENSEEIIDNFINDDMGLPHIPGTGKIVAGFMDGIANALFVLKIGYTTKNYIISPHDFDKIRIYHNSMSEVKQNLKPVITSAVNSMPAMLKKKFQNIFNQCLDYFKINFFIFVFIGTSLMSA